MKNSDLPAMPLNEYSMQETVQIDGADEGVTTTQYVTAFGLTKREHFAAMAMQGVLSNGVMMEETGKATSNVHGAVSKISLIMADALLAALEADDE